MNRILLDLVTFPVFSVQLLDLGFGGGIKNAVESGNWCVELDLCLPIGSSQAQVSCTVLRHSTDVLESLIAVMATGPAPQVLHCAHLTP